jgi:hypothetical protein
MAGSLPLPKPTARADTPSQPTNQLHPATDTASMRDTTSAAAAAQARAQKQLGGAGRLDLAFEMSLLARELTLAGLRRSHPVWSPGQLRRELLRLCFLPDDLPPALR